MRRFRHYIRAPKSKGHHTIDSLEERGVEKDAELEYLFLKGKERATINKNSIGIVSKATEGKLLRDKTELMYATLSS